MARPMNRLACFFGRHVFDKRYDPTIGFWARCVFCGHRVSRNVNERVERERVGL